MKTSVDSINECCVEIIQSKHAEPRLVIAAARAVEADVVFNMGVARRKATKSTEGPSLQELFEADEEVCNRVLLTYAEYVVDPKRYSDALVEALEAMIAFARSHFPVMT